MNKAELKQAIVSLLEDMSERVDDAAAAREQFATVLSNAVDAFVKSGQVNVTVKTTGTASAQTGTGTGSIT